MHTYGGAHGGVHTYGGAHGGVHTYGGAHGGVHTYARDVRFTVRPVPILFVVFSSQIAQWRSSDQEFGQRAYWTENCSVRLEQPQEENEGVA